MTELYQFIALGVVGVAITVVLLLLRVSRLEQALGHTSTLLLATIDSPTTVRAKLVAGRVLQESSSDKPE